MRGSGPAGRISHDDLDAFLRGAGGAAAGTARGANSSFYYGRNIPATPRSDPVNAPQVNTNPLSRPVARFGPVTPVPEPSEWAMMLAGLALVGFIVKRNSKRS